MQPLLCSRYPRRGGLLTWFLRTCINTSVMARFVYLFLSSNPVHITKAIHIRLVLLLVSTHFRCCMLEKWGGGEGAEFHTYFFYLFLLTFL